jgi:hypothetical protein
MKSTWWQKCAIIMGRSNTKPISKFEHMPSIYFGFVCMFADLNASEKYYFSFGYLFSLDNIF